MDLCCKPLTSVTVHWESHRGREGLQKHLEALRSESWGQLVKANFLILKWIKVSQSLSFLLAEFALIWENTQADGKDGVSCVSKKRK